MKEGAMDEPGAHKAVASAVFNAVAADYDAEGVGIFAQYGRRLVEAAGVGPGQRVLDVATGRGAILFPAAKTVGPTGQVVGIDLAEAMVEQVNAEIERQGMPARALVMDAERLDFPDASFDRALCGFGIMFFPDLPRALAELRRVLKPGGRLGLSTWRRAYTADIGIILDQMGVPTPGGHYHPYRTPEELRDVLAGAGFSNISVQAESAIFRFTSIKQLWSPARASWMWRRLSTLDAEQTRRAQHELAVRLGVDPESPGIDVDSIANFALATR
jgi:ubiquinone/menaquinone biosynthesis C-methylase UbiE